MLAVEKALTDKGTQRAHPDIGTDVKVMGVRQRDRIELTIGCAFVAEHVNNLADYGEKKERACGIALAAARAATALHVDAVVNAADDMKSGDVFLTVTGTSAEAGDDGEVGRGNRVGGLITPYRPMTLEAAAGKNPITHVGKLYNVVAQRIARRLVGEIPGVRDASCVLVSRIGQPVGDPHLVDVVLRGDVDVDGLANVRRDVEACVRRDLENMAELRSALLAGEVQLF